MHCLEARVTAEIGLRVQIPRIDSCQSPNVQPEHQNPQDSGTYFQRDLQQT